jgi:hypothetical protein
MPPTTFKMAPSLFNGVKMKDSKLQKMHYSNLAESFGRWFNNIKKKVLSTIIT